MTFPGKSFLGDPNRPHLVLRIVWTSDPGSSTDSLELQFPGASAREEMESQDEEKMGSGPFF